MLNLDLIKKNSFLIIGFSGGADSVCLLNNLIKIQQQLNLKLIAAHLDHQARKNSAKDLIFIKKFCSKFNIALETEALSNLKLNFKYNGSKEEFLRAARKYFLETLMLKYNADKIALAHHSDDQIETFLIRCIRGSGVSGLSCIKESNNKYIRPLLRCSKLEILEYNKNNNLNFLTDATNLENIFLRNKIRNILIPQLEKIDSRFRKNCLKTIQNINEAANFLTKHTEFELNKIKKNDSIELAKFLNLELFIQKQILLELLITTKKKFNFSGSILNEIIRFLKNDKSKNHTINSIKIIKNNNSFKIS